MFYRKTDIEVLCETLIKLVDKHDKALKKFGKEAASPHAASIEVVTHRLDQMIELDVNPLYVMQSNGKVVKATKPVDDKTPTRRFIGTSPLKKRGRPVKQKITMVSGGSDDIRPEAKRAKEVDSDHDYKMQNKIVDDFNKKQEEPKSGQPALAVIEKEENKSIQEPAKSMQTGTVTPENIDSMADQLAR